jgi:hypothetical protein
MIVREPVLVSAPGLVGRRSGPEITRRLLVVRGALATGLLLVALVSLLGCASNPVGPSSSTSAESRISTTTSSTLATKTIMLDAPAESATVQASTLLRLDWTPGPDASVAFGMSADGRTIGIAEAPGRDRPAFLHLYDDAGSPLLSRRLLTTIVHDSPFVALTDLAVVSPSTIYLLLQHEGSFRVHRLTPNDTGIGTEGVELTQGVADQLAVSRRISRTRRRLWRRPHQRGTGSCRWLRRPATA